MRPASRRFIRFAVAVAATTAVTLGVAASPAHADIWQHTDGFESNPAAVWQFDRGGDGSGILELNAGTAAGGRNNALLTTSPGGWSGVGKLLTVRPRTAGHSTTCGGGFWIRSVSGPALLNLEVIDPTTWTYVAVRTVRAGDAAWQWHAVSGYRDGPTQVFIRVSLLGGSGPARVDEMGFQCTFTRPI